MEVLDPPEDGTVVPTNCKCNLCDAVFSKPTQVKRHLVHKHKAMPESWHSTNEPVNRKDPDWRKRLAAKEANKEAVGPFQCIYCDHPPTDTVQGVAAHIGHIHKSQSGPFLVGRNFVALGTATGKRAPRRPYKKRQPKQPVASRIKEALVSGKPTITLDFDLSDDITIRVPLVLGPPVFIERNTDG